MNFQAITMTRDSAGPVYMHTSAEVHEETRAKLLPYLRLDRRSVFELPPHWTVEWEPWNGYVVFSWRKWLVCTMILAYSNRPNIMNEFRDHPAYERLQQIQLPAAFMNMSDMVAMIQPDEIIQVMKLLGDLDRCIACVYFELMEQKHQTIQ